MNLFIDTNIFLSFYHLTNDELEELRKLSVLVDKEKIKLILPMQVVNEFRRNRENKISDSLKRFKDNKFKSQFPQICKDYPEYDELRNSQIKYEKSHSKLIEKLNEDISKKKLKADLIIEELFTKATRIDYQTDVLEKAKLRVTLGNPPGKEGSFGDAVNWETLLEVIEMQEDIYFVADDKDYYSPLDNTSIKNFLELEWQEKKWSTIHFYRSLSVFFKAHFPEIKLAIEVEKEMLIQELSYSGAFRQTHSLIEKLSSFSDFTVSQVDEILRISLSNSQVRLIITDGDVAEFLRSIFKGKETKLDSNNLSTIMDYLKEDKETEDDSGSNEDLF